MYGEAQGRPPVVDAGSGRALPQDGLNGLYHDLVVLTDAEPEDLLSGVCSRCRDASLLNSPTPPSRRSHDQDAAVAASPRIVPVSESAPGGPLH